MDKSFKDNIDKLKTEFEAKISEMKVSIKKHKMQADVLVVDTCAPVPLSSSDVYEIVYNEISYLDYRFRDLYDSIARLWDSFYEYSSTHLPAINSPAEMQKAIDVLGLSENYTVNKRQIFASDGTKLGFDISIRSKAK